MNEKLLNETVFLLERYLNRVINIRKLVEDFDRIYYSYSISEKTVLIDFMEKLSLTTDDYDEAMAPESSCMIFEDEFREYATGFLKFLKSQTKH